MRFLILVAALLLPASALAQQQPDPAFVNKAVAALQAQRNQALDALAVTEAKAAGLAEDLAKAQARIKELESKPQ